MLPREAIASHAPPLEARYAELVTAVVFNFMRLTHGILPSKEGVVTVCTDADTKLLEPLRVLEQRQLGDAYIRLVQLRHLKRIAQCQVLLIGSTRIADCPQPAATLTIALPGSHAARCSLSLRLVDEKLVFSANLASAKRAGIQLEPKLLRLAEEVSK